MKQLIDKISVDSGSSIQDVMKKINAIGSGVALVTDKDNRLLGIVTDGDLRRAFIKNKKVSDKVSEIMNKKPVVAREGWTRYKILSLLSKKIQHIPIIDAKGEVKDIVTNEFLKNFTQDSCVVRGKAPFRISFAGGGTDISPFVDEKGGIVLSCTINKYCYATLAKRNDNKINIVSHEFKRKTSAKNIETLKYNGRLDLFKAAIKIMQPEYGLDFYSENDVPPGTGLGASAAAASAAIGTLNHLKEFKLDDYQVAELAYQAERIELGIMGGWQDQYATVFGGFNFIEFKEHETIVHPLRLKSDIMNELERHLLLCYTGTTRVSGDIIKNQNNSYMNGDKSVVQALDDTKRITIDMKEILLKGHMYEFGKQMHKAWQIKKKFSSTITNSTIDELYSYGRKWGAVGGKVTGAGGGGYMLFFCPPLKRFQLKEKLQQKGHKILDFSFDHKGLEVWTARS